MRLSPKTLDKLAASVRSVAPHVKAIRLFGSQLDDSVKGGDVDLMVEFDSPVTRPAWLAAQISVKASRAIENRRVDVVIKAPNLDESSIHRVAAQNGVEI